VKGLAWLLAAVVTLGCTAAHGGGRAPSPAEAADPAEYAPFLAGGDAVVEGRAFVRTRSGGTHYASGFPIILDPVTSYSRRWQRAASPDDPGQAAPDSLFVQARQMAMPVEEGRFSFSGLAAGWYYVRTLVVWDDGSFALQYYVLRDSVLAQAGRSVSMVLTRVR